MPWYTCDLFLFSQVTRALVTVRGWFNTIHVIMCTSYIKRNVQIWIFTILILYFHHVRQIQFHLDRRVLMTVTVKLCPIKSKVNSPLKMLKLFSFKTLSFSRFSMAVTQYNGWNLNTSSLCNAWWTGFESQSWQYGFINLPQVDGHSQSKPSFTSNVDFGRINVEQYLYQLIYH